MESYYQEMISRNIGVISDTEQYRLKDMTIAIAGCGGIGGLSAELLVRMGIGHIRIADLDVFEVSNVNRQFGASKSTIGKKKADVVQSLLLDINPSLAIESFSEGINRQNADNFVQNADLVIDGIDYNRFLDTVLLHRAARKKGIYIMTAQAIGFGASFLTFAPDQMTIEEYVGLARDATEQQIIDYIIPREKFCPYLPPSVDPAVVRKVVEKETEIPNIGLAQAMGTGMMSSHAVLFLLSRKQPVVVPDFIAIDMESCVLFTKKTLLRSS